MANKDKIGWITVETLETRYELGQDYTNISNLIVSSRPVGTMLLQ